MDYRNAAQELAPLRQEVWYVGANFYTTTADQADNIMAALRRGVNVTFAVVPPNAGTSSSAQSPARLPTRKEAPDGERIDVERLNAPRESLD